MKPDKCASEAQKQAEIARESDLADDHTSAMIENAEQLLGTAQRRLKRKRLQQEADDGE